MAKFPAPPPSAVLETIPADEHVILGGTWMWRIYFRGGPYPTTWAGFRDFGPTNSRFDHHEPPPHHQSRAILYGAIKPTAIRTCLAEVFQNDRVVNRVRNEPWLVGFRLTRNVVVLDMTGSWPTRAGASQAIATGPRQRARQWSRRIYEAFPSIEGIFYRSSMSANSAFALFEKAQSALPAAPEFHRALSDPALAPIVLDECGQINYLIVP